MGTIAEEDFAANLFTLLKETFEGPPPQTASAYLDQGAGLLQTVEKISAEEASRAVADGAPTIAAHCAHAKFYVSVLRKYIQGSSESVDWGQSWLVRSVGDAEWEALKGELREDYAGLTQELRSLDGWGERSVGGAMATVAHTAYHLGAIRLLARLLA